MEIDLLYAPAEPDTEETICKVFGCGKKLSRQEMLFGDYCAQHTGSSDKQTLYRLHRQKLVNLSKVITNRIRNLNRLLTVKK